MIKIYADGGDLKSIEEMASNPKIGGFTSNPSLAAKAGVKDYEQFAKDAIKIAGDKPFSFEVLSDDMNEMERQASKIANWSDTTYVKIPITNSQGISTLDLVKRLSLHGMKINVTAILTERQVKNVAKALYPKTPSIISIFAGRIADTLRDPVPTIICAVNVRETLKHEVLWASTREAYNYVQAQNAGVDIITISSDIIKKMEKMQGKNLQALSLETVRMFKSDAESSGFTL